MRKAKESSVVLWIKLAALAAVVFSGLWIAFYVSRSYVASVELNGEGAGAFAVVLAGGLALAVVVAIIIVAAGIALAVAVFACIFALLEWKYTPLRAEERKKRHTVFRVLAGIFFAASSVFLLILASMFGALGWLAALFATAGIALYAAAEIVQGRALHKLRSRSDVQEENSMSA